MGFIITACILCVFSFVFFVISHALMIEKRNFEKSRCIGKAVVVGYDGNDQSNVYNLLVEIYALNDGKLYSCEPSMSNLTDYPVGKEIDVWYAPQKIMGINVVEVHLLDEAVVDKSKLGNGMKKFAIVLFFIAFILIIIGIMSIV